MPLRGLVIELRKLALATDREDLVPKLDLEAVGIQPGDVHSDGLVAHDEIGWRDEARAVPVPNRMPSRVRSNGELKRVIVPTFLSGREPHPLS
jgi:hypothetical protein